jgi:hypothetical protein
MVLVAWHCIVANTLEAIIVKKTWRIPVQHIELAQNLHAQSGQPRTFLLLGARVTTNFLYVVETTAYTPLNDTELTGASFCHLQLMDASISFPFLMCLKIFDLGFLYTASSTPQFCVPDCLM